MFRFPVPQRKFIYTKFIFIGNEFPETRFHQSLLATSNYLYKLWYLCCIVFTFKFRRTRSMKNIQQFSLVSWSPAPFTSFLMPEMIFSTSSSAKSPGISPEANRSLISTRKLSSGTCASVNKNTVPMFFKPAFWHKFARSSWPKGEKQTVVSRLKFATVFVLL